MPFTIALGDTSNSYNTALCFSLISSHKKWNGFWYETLCSKIPPSRASPWALFTLPRGSAAINCHFLIKFQVFMSYSLLVKFLQGIKRRFDPEGVPKQYTMHRHFFREKGKTLLPLLTDGTSAWSRTAHSKVPGAGSAGLALSAQGTTRNRAQPSAVPEWCSPLELRGRRQVRSQEIRPWTGGDGRRDPHCSSGVPGYLHSTAV